jgi:hypothetical protein
LRSSLAAERPICRAVIRRCNSHPQFECGNGQGEQQYCDQHQTCFGYPPRALRTRFKCRANFHVSPPSPKKPRRETGARSCWIRIRSCFRKFQRQRRVTAASKSCGGAERTQNLPGEHGGALLAEIRVAGFVTYTAPRRLRAQRPLWVISGHCHRTSECLLYSRPNWTQPFIVRFCAIRAIRWLTIAAATPVRRCKLAGQSRRKLCKVSDRLWSSRC